MDTKTVLIHHLQEPKLASEASKALINPQLYALHVRSEVTYIVRDEFRSHANGRLDSAMILRERLLDAIALNDALQESASGDFLLLALWLVNYRESIFQKSEWKYERLRNPSDIKNALLQDLPSLKARQMHARDHKRRPQITPYELLDSQGKYSRLKEHFPDCTNHSYQLLRRHLKRLQTHQKIPNPFLLPYTEDRQMESPEAMALPKVVIPHSTKHAVIKDAYDMEYIDAIIKPDLEYDINKHHHLQGLSDIVNEKGPYQVQVRTCNAGIMPVPLIKLPYNTPKERQEAAVDIKRSVRLSRLKAIWEWGPKTTVTEPRFKDGSFAVRGSRGFSDLERVFPRSYYEELVAQEASWELLMDKIQAQMAPQEVQTAKDKTITWASVEKAYLGEWQEALDVATASINNEIRQYWKKYSVRPDNAKDPLLIRQQQLQVKMNEQYDDQVVNLRALQETLARDNVFKHSEVVNFDHSVTKKYDDFIQEDERRRKNNKKGIPQMERAHMGKKLGDYLDEAGHHSFRWGMAFDKKFKF